MTDLGNRYYYLVHMEILNKEVAKHFFEPFFNLAQKVANSIMAKQGVDITAYNFKHEGYELVENFGNCLEQYWEEKMTKEIFKDALYSFERNIIKHFKMRAVLLSKCYEYETEFVIGWGVSEKTLKEYEQFFTVGEYDDDKKTKYFINKRKNNLN